MADYKNQSLNAASKAKDDEFYTKYVDIEKEAKNYWKQLKNKIVFCNCDDPDSNFWKYFETNFEKIGIKKLVATHFDKDNPTYKVILEKNKSGELIKTKINLTGHGDFRDEECCEILEECDVVITNPPFSLFREFIAKLIEYNKKFLIIGNQNAITYKDVFQLIKTNKVWLGYNMGDMEFKVPEDSEERETRFRIDDDGIKWRSFGNICWFTNLKTTKRSQDLELTKEYSEAAYPKYDNFDAINVNKMTDIPKDYDGKMGVPVTFVAKYNPKQFKIIGSSSDLAEEIMVDGKMKDNPGRFYLNGKRMYERIIIQKK